MAYDWCVMRVPGFPGKPRQAILADSRWRRDSRIKVGFLDQDPELDELKDRVFSAGSEWLDRSDARLTFERRNDASAADIRISFKYTGSWSFLGRYAGSVQSRTEPTMNFGWLHPRSTDAEVREVVLHEFGHMLGFIHEHQIPNGLRWRRDVVIGDLSKPPNSWSVEEIERNVLDQPDPRGLIARPFDPRSIMLYAFPAGWNENGIETHANQDLSPGDIDLARDIYT